MTLGFYNYKSTYHTVFNTPGDIYSLQCCEVKKVQDKIKTTVEVIKITTPTAVRLYRQGTLRKDNTVKITVDNNDIVFDLRSGNVVSNNVKRVNC